MQSGLAGQANQLANFIYEPGYFDRYKQQLHYKTLIYTCQHVSEHV